MPDETTGKPTPDPPTASGQSPTPAPRGEPIPVAETSAVTPTPGAAPKPLLSAEPLIKLVEEMPCPRCGAEMSHDAVVCLKCGYDMRAGRVQQTAVGVPVEVAPTPEPNEFSRPGRLTPLALTIIGALLLGGAMALAGWSMPEGTGAAARAARVGLTALEAAIHTGTGLIAVAATAILLKQSLGRPDFAAARMFVAFCTFLLITRAHWAPSGAQTIVVGGIVFVQWVAALAAYWAVAMGLFWKRPADAGLLGGVHFLLYLGFSLLLIVHAWLAGVGAAPAAGVGGAAASP